MIFVGSGISNKNSLFTYNTNWESGGRWNLEICTKKNKYILRPLEEVQVIKKGSMNIDKIEFDYKIDKKFKPGLFNQVDCFLNNQSDKRLIKLEDHLSNFENYYYKIIA